MLVIISQILTKREPYRELGGTYFDEREHHRVEQRLLHRSIPGSEGMILLCSGG